MSKAASMFKGLKGVDNVYTQHTPLVANTIEALARGRLRELDYPFVQSPSGSSSALPGQAVQRPPVKDVVIFIVGGACRILLPIWI